MKRIIVWLCIAMLPATAIAAAVEDPTGLEHLRAQAQQGDVEAMLELGILYEFGFKMQEHNAPALAWYRLASEAGNAKAYTRQDALKSKISAKEAEEANKLYAELAASVRRPAPAIPPATPVAPAAQPTTDAVPKEPPSPTAPK